MVKGCTHVGLYVRVTGRVVSCFDRSSTPPLPSVNGSRRRSRYQCIYHFTSLDIPFGPNGFYARSTFASVSQHRLETHAPVAPFSIVTVAVVVSRPNTTAVGLGRTSPLIRIRDQRGRTRPASESPSSFKALDSATSPRDAIGPEMVGAVGFYEKDGWSDWKRS